MRKIFPLIIFSLGAYSSFGQGTNITPITADSLASGNYKNVFTSFFQLAFNDITSSQKAVAFSANPYAIMAKGNSDLLVDTNYVKYKHLRDLNFNVSVNLDSSYHINGFSFGAKYALINTRDHTVSKHFIVQAIIDQDEFSNFTDALGAEESQGNVSDAMSNELSGWQTDTAYTFNKLSIATQALIKKVVSNNNKLVNIKRMIEDNPNASFSKEALKTYQELVDEWQNKPLWTIAANSSFGPASTNTNALTANNILLSSEFLAGINSPKKQVKLELDLLAADQFMYDSTYTQQNIKRNIFSFEPGLNFSLKSAKGGNPFIEFKLSGTYYHIFSGLNSSEKIDSSTINGQLNIRIINDFWVPVTIKYDPVNGKVFGFLNVKANFTALKQIMK